jgi:4-hydroxybenzoate polyprenyltransferase
VLPQTSAKIKRLILKTEALWWMSRPVSRTSIILPILGWATANYHSSTVRFLTLLLFIILAKFAYALQNDLVDEEDDAISNPHLPLPSKMLSRREAIVFMWLAITGAVVSLYYASGDLTIFVTNTLLLATVFVAGYLYCTFKHTGFVASILAAVPFPIGVIMGWLVGGKGNLEYLLIVACYTVITGFCNNVLAALWDMDKDPLVGNYTIPVRIGARKAFWLVIALSIVNTALIVLLSWIVPQGYYSLPVLGVALVILTVSIGPSLDKFSQSDRGRFQRLDDVWLWSLGSYLRTVAVICVFSLPLGLIVGTIVGIASEVMLRGYNRRIVEGSLLKDLKQILA